MFKCGFSLCLSCLLRPGGKEGSWPKSKSCFTLTNPLLGPNVVSDLIFTHMSQPAGEARRKAWTTWARRPPPPRLTNPTEDSTCSFARPGHPTAESGETPRRRLVDPLLRQRHDPPGTVVPAWPRCPVWVRAGAVVGTCIAPVLAAAGGGQDRVLAPSEVGVEATRHLGAGGACRAGRGCDGGSFPFSTPQRSFTCVADVHLCCPQQLIPTAFQPLKTGQKTNQLWKQRNKTHCHSLHIFNYSEMTGAPAFLISQLAPWAPVQAWRRQA